MPARAVNHHDDMLVGVTRRDFVEEQLHAFGVDVWQDQTVQLPGTHIHRTIGIRVFMRQHGLADGAQWLGCPAPTYVRDASKPRLVLKHQLDGFARRPVFADGGERFGEFFSTPLEPADHFGGGARRVPACLPVVAVQQVVG